MNTLKNHLEHREKAELIAVITQMLRQEPDLQWLQATPLPTASSQKSSLDPELYRQQVLAAMAELIFRKRPWFAEYQKMHEISMELGNWEAVRQEALMFLETTKNISTLVAIALDEGGIGCQRKSIRGQCIHAKHLRLLSPNR
jgi:uncharacterized Zn finger protein